MQDTLATLQSRHPPITMATLAQGSVLQSINTAQQITTNEFVIVGYRDTDDTYDIDSRWNINTADIQAFEVQSGQLAVAVRRITRDTFLIPSDVIL